MNALRAVRPARMAPRPPCPHAAALPPTHAVTPRHPHHHPQEIARLATLAHPSAAPADQRDTDERPAKRRRRGSPEGGFFIDMGSDGEGAGGGAGEDEEEERPVAGQEEEAARWRRGVAGGVARVSIDSDGGGAAADEGAEELRRLVDDEEREGAAQDKEEEEDEQAEEEEAEEDLEHAEFINLGLTAEEEAAAGLASGSDSDEDPAAAAARREGRAFGYQPPWHRALQGFRSSSLKLHNEIVCFCKMLEPTLEVRPPSLEACPKRAGLCFHHCCCRRSCSATVAACGPGWFSQGSPETMG